MESDLDVDFGVVGIWMPMLLLLLVLVFMQLLRLLLGEFMEGGFSVSCWSLKPISID